MDGKGTYEYDYFCMEALAFDQSVGLRFVKGRVSEKWKTRNAYDWC